LYIALYISKQQ